MHANFLPTETKQKYGTRSDYPLLKPNAASLVLKGELAAFFRNATAFVEYHSEGDLPPRLAIRAPASLGKSTSIFDIYNDGTLAPILAKLRVLYLVPTLELADELVGKACAAGINARTFRGRSALRPGELQGGQQMCMKSDIAETLSAAGYGVAQTLCESRVATGEFEGGKEVFEKRECPFAGACLYFQQMKDRQPGLVVGTYAYLTTPIEALRQTDLIDMVIIDESFAVAASSNARKVVLTDLLRPRQLPVDAARYRNGEHSRSRDEVDLAVGINVVETALRKAIERSRMPIEEQMIFEGLVPTSELLIEDILAAFAENRPTKDDDVDDVWVPFFTETEEELKSKAAWGEVVDSETELLQLRASKFFRGLSALEYLNLEKQTIHAGMPEATQRDLASKVLFRDALAFAAFWKRLSIEVSLRNKETMNGLSIKLNATIGKGHDTRYADMAYLYGPKDIKYGKVPVLMIDASANDRIIEQFFPEFDFVSMQVELPASVRIAQVCDRTGSMTMYRESDQRMKEVYSFMQKLAEWTEIEVLAKQLDGKDRRPLFIGYKSLHEEAWLTAGLAKGWRSEKGEQIVEAIDGSFSIAHANGVRGVDRWKHTRAIAVAARMEPSPLDVESQARAIFANVERQILTGLEQWNRKEQELVAKDGRSVTVKVSMHPDELVDLVLRQIREEELVQCLARARPIHRAGDEPLTMFVLSSIPLAEFGYQPTSLFQWSSVMPDEFDRWAMDAKNAVVPDRVKDLFDVSQGHFGSYPTLRKAHSRRTNPTHHLFLQFSCFSLDSKPEMRCDNTQLTILNGNCHISNPSGNDSIPLAPPQALNEVAVEFRREGCRLRHTATVKFHQGETADDIASKVTKAFADAHNIFVLDTLPAAAAQDVADQAALCILEAVQHEMPEIEVEYDDNFEGFLTAEEVGNAPLWWQAAFAKPPARSSIRSLLQRRAPKEYEDLAA